MLKFPLKTDCVYEVKTINNMECKKKKIEHSANDTNKILYYW